MSNNYADGGLHAYDREEILDEIVELFQDRAEWHSFRTRSEIAEAFDEGRVRWVHQAGQVICAATFRHLENKPFTRVYFTTLSETNWNPEKWQQMIEGLLLESPYDRLISKTPMECREAELWREAAIPIRVEPGKERSLIVWEMVGEPDFSDIQQW